MPIFRYRTQNQISLLQPPAIESLESRTFLSSSGTPSLLVTVPGPIPSSAIAGAKANDHIEVNVANDGTGKFAGRTTVALYASPNGAYSNADAQLGTLTRNLSVPAGTSKNVAIKVSDFPQNLDGDYFLLANVITPTETVEGVSATAVDVSPPFVDFSNAIISVPGIGHLGGKISVALDVTNLGNETAKGTLDTLFEMSTSSDGSNPLQVANITSHIIIKPGRSEMLHLHVPVALGSPSGNQFIVAVLDPQDLFNESNPSGDVAISATPVSFR